MEESRPITDRCSNCGLTIEADANFCGGCGTRRALPEGRDYTADDDPWGDRRIAAEDRVREADEQTQDVLAGMGTRTGAWCLNFFLPGILGVIPFFGFMVYIGWWIGSLVLYRRGQDVGAAMVGVRVMRDNGEIAGFYHMWTRSLAAILSWLVLIAGYWTAYFDTSNQTWHDKIMGTYVIKDNPSAKKRPGTSSSAAKAWFWISVVFIIAIILGIIFLYGWAQSTRPIYG